MIEQQNALAKAKNVQQYWVFVNRKPVEILYELALGSRKTGIYKRDGMQAAVNYCHPYLFTANLKRNIPFS